MTVRAIQMISDAYRSFNLFPPHGLEKRRLHNDLFPSLLLALIEFKFVLVICRAEINQSMKIFLCSWQSKGERNTIRDWKQVKPADFLTTKAPLKFRTIEWHFRKSKSSFKGLNFFVFVLLYVPWCDKSQYFDTLATKKWQRIRIWNMRTLWMYLWAESLTMYLLRPLLSQPKPNVASPFKMDLFLFNNSTLGTTRDDVQHNPSQA